MSLKAKVRILNIVAAVIMDIYFTRCKFGSCLVVLILWAIATFVLGVDDAIKRNKQEMQDNK